MELAEKADISIPFLSNIERSNKWPYPDTLVKIAKALGVEVYMLFRDTKPTLPENVRHILDQFKKDMGISLHKSVSIAINDSIETIGSHYLDND
jgi:transcriptional regulator with XRE-family HTH domain